MTVVLQNNPFHAEGGGQIGDTGLIVGEEGTIQVEDTKKLPDGIVYVIGTVSEGVIHEGETVKVTVDRARREDLARNHTGTHMLQAALRQVLGDQVNQAGSLVLPDRLRFDFTWPEPLSQKQLAAVEQIVNDEIIKATPVSIQEMPIEEAKKSGAMALFGEKYGDIVRVVSIPGFSKELCGGSHVGNTGEIGSFRLISEGGIGSGIRRIEAVTGKAAYDLMKKDRALLAEAAQLLKGKPEQLAEKIEKTLATVKELQRELEQLKQQQTKDELGNLMKDVQEKKGVPFFGAVVHAGNMDELRKAADVVKAKLTGGAFILGTVSGDKVNLVGMAAPEAVKAGVHMGKIISKAAKICGGGGGGKPAVAQAGGKDVTKLDEAIAEGVKAIAEMLD